jgi:hypothetical protein
MEKKILFAVITVILCLAPVFSQECLKYLKMEEPDESLKGKNRLLVGLAQVEDILRGFGLPEFAGTIEIADSQTGHPFATLAKIDKGKMKWSHKLVNEKTLLVEFGKEDYPAILAKVKGKSARPGFQLQIVDAKTGQIAGKCDCSFLALPDLVATIQYPVKVTPGQALGSELSVKIENKGTASAKDFDVDVVLSSDDKIPVKPGVESRNFAEDGLLPNGRERIAVLDPGQAVNLTFKGAVSVPADTPPGKYRIGAVIDSGNVVAESDEDNNVDPGVMMVALPMPKSMAIELPETELIVENPQLTFKIQCGEVILSDGEDWKRCRLKPNVYHLQHVNWKDFHWEVDTVEKTVWEIRGAQLCKRGGNEKDMKIRVEVKGGSIANPPSRFVLKLAKTEIAYNPESRKFNLLTYGHPIDYIRFWRICNLETHLYQFRYTLWTDFYWEADTFKEELREVRGADFCKSGGSARKIDPKVRVEK